MPVELRAIHARKLGLAIHRHPARAAHSGAVHHDGIQADHGVDPIAHRQVAHRPHHHHRPDGIYDLHLLPFVHEVLQDIRHKPFPLIGAVVRGHEHLVADRAEFVLPEQQLLGARPQYGNHPVSGLPLCPRNRIDRRDADAASDAHHGSILPDLAGVTQGAYTIQDRLPLVQQAQLLCARPHLLKDQRNRPTLRIPVRQGQGNALSGIVHAQNHKLPRLRLPRDLRRFHLQQQHLRSKPFFSYNRIHETSLRQ